MAIKGNTIVANIIAIDIDKLLEIASLIPELGIRPPINPIKKTIKVIIMIERSEISNPLKEKYNRLIITLSS